MKKEKWIISIMILSLLVLTTQSGIAYEANFHREMTCIAVEVSKLEKTDYLKTDLGLSNGLEEKLTGPGGIFWGSKEVFFTPEPQEKSVEEWIEWGSNKEDKPINATRATMHFYDPTYYIGRIFADGEARPAGLTDAGPIRYLFGNPSALERARGEDLPADRPNDYSWQKAREYFYKALTTEKKEGEDGRDWYFAQTFRALGQIIHLIEDMATPAHARNDAHSPVIGPSDFYENLIWRIYSFPMSEEIETQGFNKFDDYWDTTPNENPIWIGNGLAEYTNACFLSDDTIFTGDFLPDTHRHYFVSPDLDLTTELWDGWGLYRDGSISYGVEHLARSRLLWKYLPYHLKFTIDRRCVEDYANLLIPKAISYSSGLLNYFFRGRLGVVAEFDEFTSDYRLMVTNESSYPMSDGRLELYYDDINGIRSEVYNCSFDYNYVIDRHLDKDETTIGIFTPEPDAVSYTLVFVDGRVGEEEAVVGKVFSPPPLSPPTPPPPPPSGDFYIEPEPIALNLRFPDEGWIPEAYFNGMDVTEKTWFEIEDESIARFGAGGRIYPVSLGTTTLFAEYFRPYGGIPPDGGGVPPNGGGIPPDGGGIPPNGVYTYTCFIHVSDQIDIWDEWSGMVSPVALGYTWTITGSGTGRDGSSLTFDVVDGLFVGTWEDKDLYFPLDFIAKDKDELHYEDFPDIPRPAPGEAPEPLSGPWEKDISAIVNSWVNGYVVIGNIDGSGSGSYWWTFEDENPEDEIPGVWALHIEAELIGRFNIEFIRGNY